LVYLRKEIGDSLIYLGVVAVLGGIIMGLIWCCQYALWRKYPDDDEPATNLKEPKTWFKEEREGIKKKYVEKFKKGGSKEQPKALSVN